MASTEGFLSGVLENLEGVDGILYRKMMGEYILYYKDKVVGGLYDDRLLIKPVRAAAELMPDAEYELPYDGAKPMLRADENSGSEFFGKLFESMYDQLPDRRKK